MYTEYADVNCKSILLNVSNHSSLFNPNALMFVNMNLILDSFHQVDIFVVSFVMLDNCLSGSVSGLKSISFQNWKSEPSLVFRFRAAFSIFSCCSSLINFENNDVNPNNKLVISEELSIN